MKKFVVAVLALLMAGTAEARDLLTTDYACVVDTFVPAPVVGNTPLMFVPFRISSGTVASTAANERYSARSCAFRPNHRFLTSVAGSAFSTNGLHNGAFRASYGYVWMGANQGVAPTADTFAVAIFYQGRDTTGTVLHCNTYVANSTLYGDTFVPINQPFDSLFIYAAGSALPTLKNRVHIGAFGSDAY